MSDDREVARIAFRAAGCCVAAVGVVAAAAIAIGVAGASDDARHVLRFGFGGVDRSPFEAVRIALNNARFAAGTLLCAALVPRLGPRIRTLVDVLLTALLVFNAAAVGVAIAAYGTRVIAATAPHLPLEFVALTLAGGAYMQARRQPVRVSALATVAAACAVLLGVAATLETYVSMGGPR